MFAACFRRFALLLFVLSLPLVAGASDVELSSRTLLAPTLPETRALIDSLERTTGEAEATGLALFRIHNRFGELRSKSSGRPDCNTAWMVDLASRARLLGAAFRDQAQSARAQAARAQRLMTAPTVQPLIDAGTHYQAVQLFARIDVLERRYLEASVWQRSYVEVLARWCETKIVVAPGVAGARLPRGNTGLEITEPDPAPEEEVAVEVVVKESDAFEASVDSPEPVAAQPKPAAAAKAAQAPEFQLVRAPQPALEESRNLEVGAIQYGPVAVLGIGEGVLCPGEIPAKGVVLLPEPLGCWARESCDCEPQSLLPGAVLGPGPKEAEDSRESEDQVAGELADLEDKAAAPAEAAASPAGRETEAARPAASVEAKPVKASTSPAQTPRTKAAVAPAPPPRAKAAVAPAPAPRAKVAPTPAPRPEPAPRPTPPANALAPLKPLAPRAKRAKPSGVIEIDQAMPPQPLAAPSDGPDEGQAAPSN